MCDGMWGEELSFLFIRKISLVNFKKCFNKEKNFLIK